MNAAKRLQATKDVRRLYALLHTMEKDKTVEACIDIVASLEGYLNDSA